MPTPKVYDRMCEERDQLQSQIRRRDDDIRSLRIALKPYADAHRAMELRLCPHHAGQCDCNRYSFSKAELLEARYAYDSIGDE